MWEAKSPRLGLGVVGAVSGREGDYAVLLVDRGPAFAADDRSYGECGRLKVRGWGLGVVGAVSGREGDYAVLLVDRGLPFAADDRSYGE
ncbi:hypothetical protein LT40_09185 [Pseudomonas rhizosphaerae]|uniref:Uncharacterized protein n=1 Tax=Pseudomonas rhizosphaerae TaxID=216142 RepID=A0A089YUZ0_9PSED|nr:hypothetical protein LT40_09185 [Pseudomonas rhizosphaerae]